MKPMYFLQKFESYLSTLSKTTFQFVLFWAPEGLEGLSKHNDPIIEPICGVTNSHLGPNRGESEESPIRQRDIKLERIQQHTEKRPRSTVVKLLQYKDRTDSLQWAKYLKGTKIFINEDFTNMVKKKRKDFMPELKAGRVSDNIAYLQFDKLILHHHGA